MGRTSDTNFILDLMLTFWLTWGLHGVTWGLHGVFYMGCFSRPRVVYTVNTGFTRLTPRVSCFTGAPDRAQKTPGLSPARSTGKRSTAHFAFLLHREILNKKVESDRAAVFVKTPLG